MSRPQAEDDRADQAQLGALLKDAYRGFDAFVSAALAHHHIDRRELAVLRRMSEDTRLSQQEAAERLGIDRTTMVALLDGLERKKLVRRRPHPDDRRKNIVELTDAGHEVMAAAAPTAQDAEQRFLEPLGVDGAQRFKDALRLLGTSRQETRTRR